MVHSGVGIGITVAVVEDHAATREELVAGLAEFADRIRVITAAPDAKAFFVAWAMAARAQERTVFVRAERDGGADAGCREQRARIEGGGVGVRRLAEKRQGALTLALTRYARGVLLRP